ncbi:hypothetical protein KKF84_00255 [Myxococcota bacterium]|nr:hypothetical protein [Myxococcota bacterium]
MTQAQPDQVFSSLPLKGQINWLTDQLTRESPEHLLELAATVRDSSPLSWLAGHLLTMGYFGTEENRQNFARFLVERSETAVNKITRTMLEVVDEHREHRGALCEILTAAMGVMPLRQLSSMCLIDRALKHNFPGERDEYLSKLLLTCRSRLESGSLESLTVDHLAQLSAEAIMQLEQFSQQVGQQVVQAFRERHRELALGAVQVISNFPKAVSQSNAEELLAKKVYTDPGHFLIELLQNAEDSGATVWRLYFARDQIAVWHNGTPFDTKDVVGITSIGQTTKSKSQIGFFGVGFKSIYEVTERPQLYSGAYQFEIVDVSIPKTLAMRPEGYPPDGTLLLLPLKNPDDQFRSASALFEKACALDPVVLFTLKSIDHIELELNQDAGGPGTHAIHEINRGERAISSIVQEPSGAVSHYLVCDNDYSCSGLQRQAGKPDSTGVMIGIRCSDTGVPCPLEPLDSTVYSYLPTGEHSGLRFFLQGHFDVPVDRERIDSDSAWNRWINSKVPELLLKARETLLSLGGEESEILERALGFLDILPLPHELNAPVFKTIPVTLHRELADRALIPDQRGILRCPGELRVTTPEISRLVGDLLWQEGTAIYFADPRLSERQMEVGKFLGVKSFGVRDLLDHLKVLLAGGTAGIPREHFLHNPSWETMDAVYTLFLHELASNKAQRSSILEELKKLPLVLDSGGGLVSIGDSGVFRGSAPLRQLYEGFCSFVHPRFDPEARGDSAYLPQGAHLIDLLGVNVLTTARLIQDLSGQLREIKPPLRSLEEVELIQTRERLDLVLTIACEENRDLLIRLAALPVFLAMDGLYYPLARNITDRKGALRTGDSDLSRGLAQLYQGVRPVICPQVSEDSPTGIIMRQLNIHALSLTTFVRDMQEGFGPRLTPDVLLRLHGLLEEGRDELSSTERKELVKLPIWPDEHAAGRPLAGKEAVFIPMEEGVRAFFAPGPRGGVFLHAEVASRSHVK